MIRGMEQTTTSRPGGRLAVLTVLIARPPEDYKDRLKRHDPGIDFLVDSQVPRGLDAAGECERQVFGGK
jgi:hypothetical protein